MTSRQLHITPEAIRQLTTDTEPWMSCDDCFDHVDGYVDRLLDGERDLSPQFRTHLIGCGACFEEACSLLLLAAEERGLDPAEALTVLKRELDCDALNWPEAPSDGAHGHAHRED